MKFAVWIVQIALLLQFSQVVVRADFSEFRQQLERFGLECVLKGNGTSGQPTPKEILKQSTEINRGIDPCFRWLSNDRLERRFENEMEQSGQERTNESEQKVGIKLGCEIVTEVTECLEDFESRLKECKHTPGLALLALAKTACKDAGNTFGEFINIMDECQVHRNPQFRTCVEAMIPDDVSDPGEYFQENLCIMFSKLRDCFTGAVGTCENGKYKDRADQFLDELKAQSPEAAECFF